MITYIMNRLLIYALPGYPLYAGYYLANVDCLHNEIRFTIWISLGQKQKVKMSRAQLLPLLQQHVSESKAIVACSGTKETLWDFLGTHIIPCEESKMKLCEHLGIHNLIS